MALWTNPDVARRAQFIRIEPLSLPETVFINNNYEGSQLAPTSFKKNRPNLELGAEIQATLFHSKNADQVYSRLLALRPKVEDYWSDREADKDIENYITNYESLPYVLSIKHLAQGGRGAES